jgi:two-component system phosphate regulon response regulator PhoB
MSKADKNDAKRSILIVEDSTDFSNLMKFIVEDDGFEGLQFPLEHEDIVGWVKEHKPVTILMDLALRRKGGMQYIEDLKADPATKNIPIIIITGRELNPKEVLSLQVRGVKYLRKGRIEMEEIRHAIRDSAAPKKAAHTAAKTKE